MDSQIPLSLESLLVVDLEATCWEELSPPQGETSEIIEIGICRLDLASGARDKASLIVRPVRSTVSPYCTRLTSLTPEAVANGLSFQGACEILRNDYNARQSVWASYGNYDRHQLQQQCTREKISYPFSGRHFNIKTLFAVGMGLKAEGGLSEALERSGLPFEGRPHRGNDDAWNAAALLWRLIQGMRASLPNPVVK